MSQIVHETYLHLKKKNTKVQFVVVFVVYLKFKFKEKSCVFVC